ncbi:MAG TPA: hypothetical protein VE973_00205, partial [Candidatus Limnocylindria bacterium]|nr:hypothetical protein [Candidatus Limnocylindria bacterium]
FLVKLKEPLATILKQGLEDPEPNLPNLRTAAQLIWDASKNSGLNSQVIIVTLEKEQSLIDGQFSSNSQLQTALDHAMGFACPDSGGCGNLFPGFYYQIFGNFDSSGNRYLGAAKSLMKSFSASGGRGPAGPNGSISHVGDTLDIQNTLGGYDNIAPSQSVQLSNNATAALYRYTPHVFNGNYNFWKFFNEWFKYPNGTILKLANGTDYYIIQDGLKALVPQFVAQVRNLNLSGAVIISPTEYDSYTTDKPLGPIDNTIVQINGETTKYVFLGNVKHQASDLVIKQRGLPANKVLSVTGEEAQLFEAGSILTPKDGTIIRGVTNKAVYLVQNGQIKLYSAYTFTQNKITPKQIVSVPDAEIASYTQNGFVAPKDGSLIKVAGDNTVYLVQSGLKEPVLGDIFKNRGFSLKNVASISVDELNALPAGSYATPKDRTFFAVESKTGPLFMFKDGTMHSISAFVTKQRKITPDYVFSQPVANQWFLGIPIPPNDNTIVKGDDATIYLVVKGQLRPLTYKAFQNRRITAKQIIALSQIEIDAYAKGDTLEK